jgi:hypothetical protein
LQRHARTDKTQRDQRAEQRRAARRHTARDRRRVEPKTTGIAGHKPETANARRSLAHNPNFVAAPRRRGQSAGSARRLALRNPAFVKTSGHGSRALARATFRGRFAEARLRDRHRHGHRHPIVIGWVGPLFWPYAYDDFVDYTYYPYAYDTFWPYAYDDVYEGIFGPYAYGSAEEASANSSSSTAPRRHAVASDGQTEVCAGQANELTNWPIERITQVLQPKGQQAVELDKLKDAAAKAIDALRAACPSELPSTPTGRLDAMRTRLEAMRKAVGIVRPALDSFYQSLSDEQKERFNTIGEEQATANPRTGKEPNLAKLCSSEAARTQTPLSRIERTLRPTEAQRAALGNLESATRAAADALNADCPQEKSLTPPGRLAAMQKRLDAMLKALDVVQPALEKFYSSLTDEQKAQFNRLERRRG